MCSIIGTLIGGHLVPGLCQSLGHYSWGTGVPCSIGFHLIHLEVSAIGTSSSPVSTIQFIPHLLYEAVSSFEVSELLMDSL